MRCLLFLLFSFNGFSFYDFLSIEYTKPTTDAEVNLQEAHNDSGAMKTVLQGSRTSGESCEFDTDCMEMYVCKRVNLRDNDFYFRKTCQYEPTLTESEGIRPDMLALWIFLGAVFLGIFVYVLKKLRCMEYCCDTSSSYGRRRTITPPGSLTTIPPNNPFQSSDFQTREAGRTDSMPTRPSAPSANASNLSDSPPAYYAAILESKPVINKDKNWSTFEEPPNYASINPT